MFAGLLDDDAGWIRIAPAGVDEAGTQSYDERTMSVRTVLPGRESLVEVLDFLPWDGGTPEGRIVRVVTALRGPVDVEVVVAPGRAFGPAMRVSTFSHGIAFDGRVARTAVPVDGRRAVLRLDAGERAVVTVDDTAVHEPLSVDAAMRRAERTAVAWRRELRTLEYAGDRAALVERLVLALRALGTARAVTTSLPVHEGGERNVDERLAWVADVAGAVPVLARLGLDDRVDAHAGWLRAVLADHGLPVPAVLSIDGSRPGAESEVAGLRGWRRSQPVRTGHAAVDQLHLDHLGSLADAAPWLPDHEALRRIATWLTEGNWTRPDAGAWDVRSAPRRFPATAVQVQRALDAVARRARRANPLDLDALSWATAAGDVASWLDEHLVDPPADAALLRLAWEGPWPADDRRVVRTVDRLLDALGTGPFVAPLAPSFDDGFPSGAGASVQASAWAVRALAATGRWDAAHDRMDALVALVGPGGVVPGAVEPLSGAWLGNAAHHGATVAMLDALIALADGPH